MFSIKTLAQEDIRNLVTATDLSICASIIGGFV